NAATNEPSRLDYQASLRSVRMSLADVLLKLGEIDEAADLANEMASHAVTSDDACDAANLLAQCIPLVERYKAAVRKELAEECGARAVELLRTAAARGADVEDLLASPACAVLKDRADFAALVAELTDVPPPPSEPDP